MKHHRSPLEERLLSRSCNLKAYQVRLSMWRSETGSTDWPRTQEQLKQAHLEEVTSSDWKALKELDQKGINMDEESNIQSRIIQLTKGGPKKQTLPKAPGNLGKLFEQNPEAGNVPYEDQDSKYWQKKYPSLDLETAQALVEQSDPDYPDHFPKHIVVAIGAHFVDQGWTSSELQQWCSSFVEPKAQELTSKERAKLYGTLSSRVLQQAYNKSNCIGEMVHLSELIQVIPLQDLKLELEQAGLEPSDDDKPSVIVALVKHMYADVLPKTLKASDEDESPVGIKKDDAKRRRT